MHKIVGTLAGGLAAALFAATASAQVTPTVTGGGVMLQPIRPQPPAVPVSAQQPVATLTTPQAATAAQTAEGNADARIAPPSQFGDITRGVLALQVSGRVAGKPLVMQEPVALAGWDRYLKSFQRNLPQWFGERVRTGGAGGGMSGGGGQ